MVIKTLKRYWGRQFSQVKEEGVEVILRKLKTVSRRVIILIFSILAIPVVLVVRAIKSWYWIRFGWLFGSRIGHFAFDTEYYLTEKKLGLHPDQVKDIFFYRWGKPANSFFSKLTERHLSIRNWAEPLFVANDWLPGSEQHKILPAIVKCGSRDKDGLFRQASVQLSFTEKENKMGLSFLESIGVGNKKFVCLIVRDYAYLKWSSYHNYRDSDINIYSDAALTLAEKGYVVFRMGKIVHESFNIEHANIIDYAVCNYRSDFLDIWLMANCFFCISNGTGLDEISRIFRRPAVYINYLPFKAMVTYDHVISVPKHLVWQGTKKKLTLSEHLIHSYAHSNEYEIAKINVQELSSEEINQTVLEMESRLNENWKETEEDQQLQNRFWDIFGSNEDLKKYNGSIHPKARVGSHYLRNNPEWLN